MADSFPTGRFVWYELLTVDQNAARDFYQDVVGWKTDVWDGGESPYTMWMNGERAIGGIMKLPEEAKANGAPPHWLAYIATPDVEELVEKAKGLGATVLAGIMDIPSVGKIAVIQDPQGAVFSAYTPSDDPPGVDGQPKELDFCWHELTTTDHVAAFDFYQVLFGWKKTDSIDMGEMGTYQMYGRPGESFPLGGVYNKPPQMPAPPHWLLYIQVPNLEAALETVKEKGGQVLCDPSEVPGGHVVQCMDPQGAAFALFASSPAE